MKGQKNEILTRQESRPDVFYFYATAHFLKQLPTHIAHIAKAPRANAETKALSKSAILLTLMDTPVNSIIFRFLKLKYND